MSDISFTPARLSGFRTSTTILSSVFTGEAPAEPGMIPHMISDLFSSDQSIDFVNNIARIVMEQRAKTQDAPKIASATSAAPAVKADPISYNRVNDKFTDVRGGSGNDSMTLHAIGHTTTGGGAAVLDSGSIVKVNSKDGDDTLVVDAEILAAKIDGGDGNDKVTVTAGYAKAIFGGAGDDELTVDAYSIDEVSGGTGNDTIKITAHVDKSLTEILAFSAGHGNVSKVIGGDGNDTIDIVADRRVDSVTAGQGNDKISIKADQVHGVGSGTGDDEIDIAAQFAGEITGGTGNDKIAFNGYSVYDIDAGEGDDSISVNARSAYEIKGGSGKDTIKITASYVSDIDGGNGDDTIEITDKAADATGTYLYPKDTAFISGGSGDDRITINTSSSVRYIDGGSGNDVINIIGSSITEVGGGHGDDTITLQQTSKKAIDYHFAVGDGHDTITTSSDLNIRRYSADGTRETGMDGAKIGKGPNGTYTVTFAGSKDSITLKYADINAAPGTTAVPRLDGSTIRWDISTAKKS